MDVFDAPGQITTTESVCRLVLANDPIGEEQAGETFATSLK
jgi:hypothetical protein